MQIFPSACFGLLFWQYLYKRKKNCDRFELPGVAAMLGHSLLMKSRIRLSNDVYNTFAMPHILSLVMMSLTQTAFSQYGSTHSHIFTPFRCCF